VFSRDEFLERLFQLDIVDDSAVQIMAINDKYLGRTIRVGFSNRQTRQIYCHMASPQIEN
jgi:hypothetical protein